MTASARFDIVALARRINLRRDEFNRLFPHRPVRITPALSRILENDPDYIPSRRRNPVKKRRPALNPSIRSLVNIAAALGTTVGDLLSEPILISPADEHMLRELLKVFEKLGVRPARSGG